MPEDWAPETIEPTTPPSIVAVPAAGRTDLRGRRVLIGLPGIGWRGDLRADAAIVQTSRTYVPVLAEHEWYRAESERTEVFAPLVPIERVWIEVVSGGTTAGPGAGGTTAGRGAGGTVASPGAGGSSAGPGSGPGIGADIFSRLVSLDAPPRRDPIPVRDLPGLTGRRIVQAEGVRAIRDLRAVTEAYQNHEGDICVRVCAEHDWYRWGWSGTAPSTREVPIYLLWAE